MFLSLECHQPLAKRARPRLCYQWHCIGFAFGLCAAVLQCAPRARTKGRGMLRIRLSASKDAPATGADRERPCASRIPFSHQRKSNASHKAKRFQKRAGHKRGRERIAIITPLSSPQARPLWGKALARSAPFRYTLRHGTLAKVQLLLTLLLHGHVEAGRRRRLCNARLLLCFREWRGGGECHYRGFRSGDSALP